MPASYPGFGAYNQTPGNANFGTYTPPSASAEAKVPYYLGANPDAIQSPAWGSNQVNSPAALAAQQANTLGAHAAVAGQQQATTLGALGATDARAAQQQAGQAQYGYGQEQQALGQVAANASGNGPAQQQAQLALQSGVEQSIQAQQAAANSTRGASGAANAQYNAAQQAGQAQQNANFQAANLGAQQQQAAQAAYLQGAGGVTAQALGAQQGFGQLATGAQTAAAGAQENGLALQQGYTNSANAVNTAASNAALSQRGLAQQQSQFNTNTTLQELGTGAAAVGTTAAFLSDEAVKTDIDGVADPTPLQTQQSNQNAAKASSGFANAFAKLGQGTAPVPQQGPVTYSPQTFSDERTKVYDGKPSLDAMAAPQGPAQESADRFLGGLHEHTFEYRDPSFEPRSQPNGGKYLGVLAQELEQTPEGAQAVETGADGLKRLNVPALTSANTAALGRVDERLRALEKAFGRKKAA